MLNPGESVKFGLTTIEKVNAINWKALDQNENRNRYKKNVYSGNFPNNF